MNNLKIITDPIKNGAKILFYFTFVALIIVTTSVTLVWLIKEIKIWNKII